MGLGLIIAILLLQLVHCELNEAILQPIHQCSFEDYQKEYHKTYTPSEIEQKKMIFEGNCKKVVGHNANRNNKYLLSLKEDADLSD